MELPTPTHQEAKNWPEILWREWRACEDRDYEKHLHAILSTDPLSWLQSLSFNLYTRPSAIEVETALRTACRMHQGIRYLWQKRLAQLDRAKKKPAPPPKLILQLQDNHWFERFIARHMLVDRGGEAVELLIALAQTDSDELHALACWLLESIGEETTARLAAQAAHLLCARCVVHCHRFDTVLADRQISYYGCRLCRQSRDFQVWPGGVVAVLDQANRQEKIQAHDQIRVNWLRHRALFDFDRVEIIQATDEAVERFAVQVGNDTEPGRASRYKEMACLISPACHLSDNTIRILDHVFGRIDQGGH